MLYYVVLFVYILLHCISLFDMLLYGLTVYDNYQVILLQYLALLCCNMLYCNSISYCVISGFHDTTHQYTSS